MFWELDLKLMDAVKELNEHWGPLAFFPVVTVLTKS
jgi:hypothetical protein